jgi:hypothetical protein
MWALRKTAEGLNGPQVVLKRPGTLISSFGETNAGELLVTGFLGDQKRGNSGRIWWLVADE